MTIWLVNSVHHIIEKSMSALMVSSLLLYWLPKWLFISALVDFVLEENSVSAFKQPSIFHDLQNILLHHVKVDSAGNAFCTCSGTLREYIFLNEF